MKSKGYFFFQIQTWELAVISFSPLSHPYFRMEPGILLIGVPQNAMPSPPPWTAFRNIPWSQMRWLSPMITASASLKQVEVINSRCSDPHLKATHPLRKKSPGVQISGVWWLPCHMFLWFYPVGFLSASWNRRFMDYVFCEFRGFSVIIPSESP